MPTINMLDISTAHVSRETATMLDGAPAIMITAYQKNGYGWFVWVPPADFERTHTPDDLSKVFAYAREQKCDWVMFDRDAEIIDDLPSFDW